MLQIAYFIKILFDLLIYLIIIRILLSWMRPRSNNALIIFIIDTSEPILNFVRKFIPRFGMLDFSPVVAIIGLEIIRSIILNLLLGQF